MANPEDRADAQRAFRRVLALLAILVLAVGLTGVGAYMAFDKADLALRGEIVWGQVVAVEPEGADPPETLVVEFTRKTGLPVIIRHAENIRPTGLGVGSKVPVNFLPEAPEEARVLGRINWIPPVLLLLLGPTLIVLAIRGIRIERRRANGLPDFPD